MKRSTQANTKATPETWSPEFQRELFGVTVSIYEKLVGKEFSVIARDKMEQLKNGPERLSDRAKLWQKKFKTILWQ